MADESIRIELRLTGTGWLRADVYTDKGTAAATASYLTDALGDLLVACALIGEGIDRVDCRWAEEPGWALWSIVRSAEDRVRITLRVSHADADDADAADDAASPEEGGQVVLVLDHDLRRFLEAVLAAVDALHADVGEHGYLVRWVEHPFPVHQVERLREAIHGVGVGPVPWPQLVRAGAHRWFGVERLRPADLAVELLVDVMYELACATDTVCTVEVAERSVTVIDDGPGWRVRPVFGVDSLVALLGAVHLPPIGERGELAHVAAVSEELEVQTVTGSALRRVTLARGVVVDGPTTEPAPATPTSTRVRCEPDWAWFGVDAGWPSPLPDLIALAATRSAALPWWSSSILDRIVLTDVRSSNDVR